MLLFTEYLQLVYTSAQKPASKKVADDIMPSERIKTKSIELLHSIINSEEGNLLKQVAVKKGEEDFNLPGKKRVGRPRINWILETAKLAWARWKKEAGEELVAREFDLSDKNMMKDLINLAKSSDIRQNKKRKREAAVEATREEEPTQEERSKLARTQPAN